MTAAEDPYYGMSAEQYADYCAQYYAEYDEANAQEAEAAAARGEEESNGDALGLLAGYGSDSDEEEGKPGEVQQRGDAGGSGEEGRPEKKAKREEQPEGEQEAG